MTTPTKAYVEAVHSPGPISMYVFRTNPLGSVHILIDMRLAVQRREHLPTFNECARRLLKVTSTFGGDPYLVGASSG